MFVSVYCTTVQDECATASLTLTDITQETGDSIQSKNVY